MRILAVYPYLPYPTNRGAYHRGFQLLRELARAHEVDLLALAENCEGAEHKAVFTEFCRRVEIIPFHHPPWEKLFPARLTNPLPATVAHWTLPAVAAALRELLDDGNYDAVHLFDVILGQYFLREHRHYRLIADRTRVDLQYQLMELRRMRFSFRSRLLALENLFKLWRYERAMANRSFCQVVCGGDDEKFLRRYVQSNLKIQVIPNGVDLEYFHPGTALEQARAEVPTILFCGAMDYNPNIDALRWYFAEMDEPLRRRIPGLRLLIVGKDPVPEVRRYAGKSHVIVTGGVPDVRPYYRQAWLQTVPLRIGGGTRLKIVESMAMETPVVSTTIGAQGLDLRDEFDVIFADTADKFVLRTARLLEDIQLRRRISENGLETVRARLSWPSLGGRLIDLYASIPSQSRAPEKMLC
jgi:polysaccharide biosynthesis protein PslH